jgi:hypothetical protein
MTFTSYYRVSTDRIHLETVYLEQAQEYVRKIYNDSNVIANIDEIRNSK